jgi:uncharacterized Tic20 family protein
MTDSSSLPIGPRRAAMWIHLSGVCCAPLAIALVVLISIVGPNMIVYSGLGFLLFGAALGHGVLIPLGVWSGLRHSDPFVDESGRHAVNFHGSMAILVTIYGLASSLIITSLCASTSQPNSSDTIWTSLGVLIFFVSVVLLGLQGLFSVVLSFYGASRALGGHVYCYPFALNFFKARL